MTLQKKYIEDKDGNQVLPITHLSAVKDDNGTPLDTVIGNIEENLGTGGSVDNRIATAKTEIIGGATSNGNTLKKLEDRLSPVETAVGSVDSRISSAVATETTRAQAAEADRYTKSETYTKEEVHNLITTPNQEYMSVTATDQTTAATDVLPATGAADTTYRVGNWDGTQYNDSVFSEYAWNGSAYIKLSTKSQVGEVYDISANHADTKYADLAAALGTNGTNVPVGVRKGGMSVKFVQSSDNKYVQARLMADSFTTDVTKWQGVDDEPTAGSQNLVKSGGVYEEISQLGQKVIYDVINENFNQIKIDKIEESLLHYTVDSKDVFVQDELFRSIIFKLDNLKGGFAFDGEQPVYVSIFTDNPIAYPNSFSRRLGSDRIFDGYYTIDERAGEKYIVFTYYVNTITVDFSILKLRYSIFEILANMALGYDLIRITSWVLRKCIDNNGAEQNLSWTDTNYAITEGFYPCSANDEIITNIVTNTITGIYFYDSSYNYIGVVREPIKENIYKVLNNSNIKYLRIGTTGLIDRKVNGYELFVGIRRIGRLSLYDMLTKKQTDDNPKIPVIFKVGYGIMPHSGDPTFQAGEFYHWGDSDPNYAAEEDYISVSANDRFVISGSFNALTGVAFYDSNKDFVSGYNAIPENDIISVPNDNAIAFMRLGYKDSNGIVLEDCYIAKFNGYGAPFIEKNLKRIEALENKGKLLNGVKVAIFGDSISAYKDVSSKNWGDYFSEVTGANVVNFAIGGTCLRSRPYPSSISGLSDCSTTIQISGLIHAVAQNDYSILSDAVDWYEINEPDFYPTVKGVYDRLVATDFSNIDIVVIFGGANDYPEMTPQGTPDSTDTTTINGAINDMCQRLQTAYPQLHIVFLTPIAGYYGGHVGDATYWEGTYQINGHTKENFVAWIAEAAHRNMLPYYNMYWEIGINQYNFLNYFDSNDGHHPYKGFKYIGEKIAAYIESIFKFNK